MDFFDNECQSKLNNPLFGLCDDDDGKKAYVDIGNPSKWIAPVHNVASKDIVFTAIDKCVIKDNEHTGRGRCDAMLTSSDFLYLIELKDSNPPWQSKALEQLESTIQFLIANHDIRRFKHKKAFACNKRKGKFVVTDNEQNKRWHREYGFRIDIQARIIAI